MVHAEDIRLKAAQSREAALDVIADTLARVRYGSVAVTVHDGKIVQLDITEKRRLD